MPFNGSNGTFNRLYNFAADAAAGIKILASRMDAEINGIAAGLSNCLTRDGQSPPSVDLPLGGKKIVNLGTPTAAGDAATKGYVDGFASLSGATFTGAISGTTATFTGAMTAAAGLTSLSDVVAAGSGGGNAILSGSGDITTSRSGGTTGAVYFGSSASAYLFFTGTWFSFTGGGVKLETNQQVELGGASVRFSGSKLLLAVGATDIASLDGSGNLRVLGNVTANAGSL